MLTYKLNPNLLGYTSKSIEEVVSSLENRIRDQRSRYLRFESQSMEETVLLMKNSRHAVLIVEEEVRMFSVNIGLSLSQVHGVNCYYCLGTMGPGAPFSLEPPLMVYFLRGERKVEVKLDQECYDHICSVLSRDLRFEGVSRELNLMEQNIRMMQRVRYILGCSWAGEFFSRGELRALERAITADGQDRVSKLIDAYTEKSIPKRDVIEGFYEFLKRNTALDSVTSETSVSEVMNFPRVSELEIPKLQLQKSGLKSEREMPNILLPSGSFISKDARLNLSFRESEESVKDPTPKNEQYLKNCCLADGFDSPWARGFLASYLNGSLQIEHLIEIIDEYLLEKDLMNKKKLSMHFEETSNNIIINKLNSHGMDIKTIDWLEPEAQQLIYSNFEKKGDLDALIYELQHKVGSYSSPHGRGKKNREERIFFRTAPKTRSYENLAIEVDNLMKSEKVYFNMANKMFNKMPHDYSRGAALLSPTSPDFDKRYTDSPISISNDFKKTGKRGSVDLDNKNKKKGQAGIIIVQRVELPDKNENIESDHESSSGGYSNQSPASKSKSKFSIEFPSNHLFDVRLKSFYREYSDKIEASIREIMPFFIRELEDNQDVYLTDKEIYSMYDVRWKPQAFFLFICHFQNRTNLSKLTNEDSRFLLSIKEDFHNHINRGEEAHDKLKEDKAFFDTFATAQLEYFCRPDGGLLMNKQAANLQALLAGSNMLILAAFEVWFMNRQDADFTETLLLLHKSIFGKKSQGMTINLIKTGKESEKGSSQEEHENPEANREKDDADEPVKEVRTPGMVQKLPNARPKTPPLPNLVVRLKTPPVPPIPLNSPNSPESRVQSLQMKGAPILKDAADVMSLHSPSPPKLGSSSGNYRIILQVCKFDSENKRH